MKRSFSKKNPADSDNFQGKQGSKKRIQIAKPSDRGQQYVFVSKEYATINLHFEKDRTSPLNGYIVCLKVDEDDPTFCPYCSIDADPDLFFIFPVLVVMDLEVKALMVKDQSKESSLCNLLQLLLPDLNLDTQALNIRYDHYEFTLRTVDQPGKGYGRKIINEFLQRHKADNDDRWSPELEEVLKQAYTKYSMEELKQNVNWIDDQFGSIGSEDEDL